MLLVILVITFYAVNTNQKQNYQLSRDEKLVNTTLAIAAKIIKEKYHIKPCGEGASMPEGPILL